MIFESFVYFFSRISLFTNFINTVQGFPKPLTLEEEKAEFAKMKKGDILLHGHTHVPAAEQFGDGYYYINPGSLSIPKENSQHSYLMLEGRTFTWKNVETGETIRSFTVE